MTNKLYFAKDYDDAKLPNKNEEDGGFDLYMYDNHEVELLPQQIKILGTGVRSAFPKDYVMLIRERGSSGIKGLAVRAGVVDSGFRGEIKVVLNNTTNKTIILSENIEETKKQLQHGVTDTTYVEQNYIIYPLTKAIAQAVVVPLANLEVEEISKEDLLNIDSERGEGMLGSTDK